VQTLILAVMLQTDSLVFLVQDLPNFAQGPRMFGKRKTPLQNSRSIPPPSIDSGW
jgi:hypothetical protein